MLSPIDSLRFSSQLMSLGLSPEQAREIASTLRAATVVARADLLTRSDLAEQIDQIVMSMDNWHDGHRLNQIRLEQLARDCTFANNLVSECIQKSKSSRILNTALMVAIAISNVLIILLIAYRGDLIGLFAV